MTKIKWFLILLTVFLISGCASKTVYQIQGVPVPDKVVQAKVFALDIVVTYDLTKNFLVKEDDESYRSHEYLSLVEGTIHKIRKDETLTMKISVFNPNQEHYKIKQHTIIEGRDEYDIVVYNGDISRNSFQFGLPAVESKRIVFFYDVYDEKDNLVYQSFRAQYIIEG